MHINLRHVYESNLDKARHKEAFKAEMRSYINNQNLWSMFTVCQMAYLILVEQARIQNRGRESVQRSSEALHSTSDKTYEV